MPKIFIKNANSVIEGNYDNTGCQYIFVGFNQFYLMKWGRKAIQYPMFYLAQIFARCYESISLYISQVQKFSYFKIFKSYQMIHSLVCAQGKSSDCQILECMAMRYILHVILDKQSSLVFDTLSLQDLF